MIGGGGTRPFASDEVGFSLWVVCEFTAPDAFEPLQALFDAQLRLSEGDDWEAFEKVEAEIIARRFELWGSATGERISDFLIHFEGDKAWFRYK